MVNLDEYVKDIFNKMDEDEENMKKLNIMTIGKTGTGKSTLINAIFGEEIVETGVGKPVTQNLKKIELAGNPVSIYDTRGIELDSEGQKEARDEIVREIKKRADLDDSDERIHIIWYCINAGSNRIEEYEIELIEKLQSIAPVIIVLTQSLGKEAVEFAKYIKSEDIKYDGLITVLAKDYQLGGMEIKAHGLKDLANMTYNMLEEGVRRSFINAQRVDLEKKEEISTEYVKKAIKASAVVGITPIPFSDAGVLVPLQTMMLGKITTAYGLHKEDIVKTVLSGVIGMGGTTIIGRGIVSNALKFIPGGNIVGSAISGSTAGIVTGALGYSYIKVLNYIAKENNAGRKVSNDIIVSLMKKYFEENSSKGKLLLKGLGIKEDESMDELPDIDEKDQ
ncbi:MAG: 50S ribosome-binding GTPase [Andreesenia angusta]|nr:50S ribosome-binding GTPase [Andreesenia angusta]